MVDNRRQPKTDWRVHAADSLTLDTWLDRILTARTLDEVWEEGQSLGGE